jgi:photosystem II stability/assembly factor-like uncharacterized protein
MCTNLFLGTKKGLVIFERDGADWKESRRGLEEHRITSVTATETVILAGTPAGIFRSVDLGQSWQKAEEGPAHRHVRWLSGHPENPSLLFAGTEPAAIFVSQDQGKTWQSRPEVAQLRDEHGWYLPYSQEAGCIRGFASHGDRLYAAAEVGGVLRSDDRGANWNLVKGSSGSPRTVASTSSVHPDVHSIVVHPSSADRVFAATGGGLYRSEDGGHIWELLYPCYCRAVWLDPQDPEHILFGPADSVDVLGRIEETTDGGQTWELASTRLQVPWRRHMVERFAQFDDQLLAVLSNGHMLAAPVSTLVWHRIFPQVERIAAVTFL